MSNYLSDRTGAEIDAALDKADLSIGTNNTGITSNGDLHLIGGNLTRNAFESGNLEGMATTSGSAALKTNPIFTLGSSFNPNEEDLNNMFGVGFAHGSASFLNQFTGAQWGVYVADVGVANIFMDGSNGRYYGNSAVLGAMSVDGALPTGGEGVVAINPEGRTHEIYISTQSAVGSTHMTFLNPNGQVGSIVTSGTSTAYNVSSDERLKEHFEPITDAFDLVKSIVESEALAYFNFKADPSLKVPGFVAQRLIACGAGGMVSEGEGSLGLDVEIGTLIQAAVIERTELTEEVTDSNGKLKTVGTGEFTEKVITPEKRVTPCGVDQSKAVPHLMQLCYDQQIQINALLARLDAANI